MDAVFSTTEKAGPQSAGTPENVVIFQVTKIEPPRTPTFDEVKDRVALEFKGQRAGDLLKRKTQELADRAHAEHDLAKAAKEAGVTVQTSDLVGRTQNRAGYWQHGWTSQCRFQHEGRRNQRSIESGSEPGSAASCAAADPSPTDPEFAKSRDQIREKLIEEKRQDVIGLFMSSLNQRLKKEGKIKEFKTSGHAN